MTLYWKYLGPGFDSRHLHQLFNNMQKLFENWRKFKKNALIESEIDIPDTLARLSIDEKIPKKIHKQITKTVFQATKDLINSYKTGGSNSKIIMDLLIKMSAGKGIKFTVSYEKEIKISVNNKNVRQIYSKYIEPVFQELFMKGDSFSSVDIVHTGGSGGGAENVEGMITISYPFYSFDGLYANLMHEFEHVVEETFVEAMSLGFDRIFPEELSDLLAKIIKVKNKELTWSQETSVDAEGAWDQGPQSIDGTHTPYFRASNEIRARVKTAQHLLRKSSGNPTRDFTPEDIEIICKMLPQRERGAKGMTAGGNEPIVNKIGDITPEIAYVIRPLVDCEKVQQWAEYLNSVAQAETKKSSLPAE